jgi:hypothetical protein
MRWIRLVILLASTLFAALLLAPPRSWPPTRRRAKPPKPELSSWQSPAADDATDRLNMLDCFLVNSSARTSD